MTLNLESILCGILYDVAPRRGLLLILYLQSRTSSAGCQMKLGIIYCCHRIHHSLFFIINRQSIKLSSGTVDCSLQNSRVFLLQTVSLYGLLYLREGSATAIIRAIWKTFKVAAQTIERRENKEQYDFRTSLRKKID
jgi:hypothetical protein